MSPCTQISQCNDAQHSIGQNRVYTYVYILYLVYNYLCTRVRAKLRVFCMQGGIIPWVYTLPGYSRVPNSNYIARALPVRIEDSFSLQNYTATSINHVHHLRLPYSVFQRIYGTGLR
jgi:hypothetical protein